MHIRFHTNLDHYRLYKNAWPILPVGIVPRIGEYVQLGKDFQNHFLNRGLPIELIVTNVTYCETEILVELWYKQIDADSRDIKVLF
jgi:hypothetical protein